jgi:C1A family cysteine protease
MSREYGNHIVLNHQKCTSESHIEEYNKKLKQTPKQITEAAAAAAVPIYTLSTKYNLNILDQGTLGSCVATSYASIIQSTKNILPSRLYLYFNALAGTRNNPAIDSGVDLLQAMPILTSFGIPDEYLWTYDKTKFGTIPPLEVYKAAKPLIVTWTPIQQTDTDIKSAVLNGKFIMLGITIYSSFMKTVVSNTGIIPLPDKTLETKEGGHGIQIIGWTTYNSTPYYIFRNSWGKSWGNDGNPLNPSSVNNGMNRGFGFIPVAYVLDTNLAYDLIAVL